MSESQLGNVNKMRLQEATRKVYNKMNPIFEVRIQEAIKNEMEAIRKDYPDWKITLIEEDYLDLYFTMQVKLR